MAWTALSASRTTGELITAAIWNSLEANLNWLRQAIPGVNTWLGGSLDSYISDTSYVDVQPYLEVELDGTTAPGAVYVCVNARAIEASAVTISMRLYNVTTAAEVASSELTVVNPSTTITHAKSGAIALTAGVDRYKAQIKSSNGVRVAGVAWVSARAS